MYLPIPIISQVWEPAWSKAPVMWYNPFLQTLSLQYPYSSNWYFKLEQYITYSLLCTHSDLHQLALGILTFNGNFWICYEFLLFSLEIHCGVWLHRWKHYMFIKNYYEHLLTFNGCFLYVGSHSNFCTIPKL